jgi:hypothetical protein
VRRGQRAKSPTRARMAGALGGCGAQRSRELLLARNGISGTLTKRADRRSSRTSTWRLGRPEHRLLDMPRWRRERSAPRCTEADMCAAFAMSADCGSRSTSAPWPSSRAEPVDEECIVEGLAASTVVRAQVDLDLLERVVDRRDHTEAVFDRYRARLRSPAPQRRSASATPAGTGSGGPGRSSSTMASASRSAAAHRGGCRWGARVRPGRVMPVPPCGTAVDSATLIATEPVVTDLRSSTAGGR